MRPVLLVPGIYNSGPTHWQSIWQHRHRNVARVMQRDWDHPVCDEWVQALDQAIEHAGEPPIVVAHSLGCLAVAHWASRSDRAIHSMLLVAVPDPDGPAFPAEAIGFAPVPRTLGGRRVTLVSSTDDPYASPSHTARYVADWQAEHVCLGAAGHINGDSNLGEWTQGWAIVNAWRSASTQ
jgi:uncharacterized protein